VDLECVPWLCVAVRCGDMFDLKALDNRAIRSRVQPKPARAKRAQSSCVIVQVFGSSPADTTPADPKQPFWVKLGP
jgi:hypothetical protein